MAIRIRAVSISDISRLLKVIFPSGLPSKIFPTLSPRASRRSAIASMPSGLSFVLSSSLSGSQIFFCGLIFLIMSRFVAVIFAFLERESK